MVFYQLFCNCPVFIKPTQVCSAQEGRLWRHLKGNYELSSILPLTRPTDYLNKGRDKNEQLTLLKVPSHQIRSAWKWYGWMSLNMYMDRGWKKDFCLAVFSVFWNEVLPAVYCWHARRCMQFAVTAGKRVKRETDYLLQQHQQLSGPFKQNW
jgi:hypothetical protein